MMGWCGLVLGKTESMWVIRDAGKDAGTTNIAIGFNTERGRSFYVHGLVTGSHLVIDNSVQWVTAAIGCAS